MRYIDADRLRKDILGLPNCYNGFSDTYDKALIIDRIDEQPTADVVEVVRCKDCKHRKKNTHYTIPLIDRVESGVFCLHNMRHEDNNGFCSYGEKADT